MHTILIVEDNEMNRDMLSRRLRLRGYVVLCAATGREGLDTVRRERPHLVLMDISLPEMDGLEATRHLKGDAGTRDIPVIALTAHALLSDRDRALAAGCDDYDTKPVDFARLLGKMAHLLPRSIQ